MKKGKRRRKWKFTGKKLENVSHTNAKYCEQQRYQQDILTTRKESWKYRTGRSQLGFLLLDTLSPYRRNGTVRGWPNEHRRWQQRSDVLSRLASSLALLLVLSCERLCLHENQFLEALFGEFIHLGLECERGFSYRLQSGRKTRKIKVTYITLGWQENICMRSLPHLQGRSIVRGTGARGPLPRWCVCWGWRWASCRASRAPSLLRSGTSATTALSACVATIASSFAPTCNSHFITEPEAKNKLALPSH